ncbi:MAG: hypothetical protein ACFE8U_12880 [Candidatus Hermodarchaeota archaeon]
MNEDEWHEPMRFEIKIVAMKSDCRVNHTIGEKFDVEYQTPHRICGEA